MYIEPGPAATMRGIVGAASLDGPECSGCGRSMTLHEQKSVFVRRALHYAHHWTRPVRSLPRMTKSELISKLAKRFPQRSAKDVEITVNTILEAMLTSLVNGRRIEVRGFGSFTINKRPACAGRNPKTGQHLKVPEKFVPHFKAGRELRKSVDS